MSPRHTPSPASSLTFKALFPLLGVVITRGHNEQALYKTQSRGQDPVDLLHPNRNLAVQGSAHRTLALT